MHKLRRALTLGLSAMCLVTYFGCSNQKLRLPQEEIYRPLSLPHQNWRIGIGTGAHVFEDQLSEPRFETAPVFLYPYFELGRRWEYYIPLTFKYYLLKNLETRDSTIFVTGPNCAITAGWSNIVYSRLTKLSLQFDADLTYKQPISQNVWFHSNLGAYYQTNVNDYGGSAHLGLGFQLSRLLYLTVYPSISYFKYAYYSPLNERPVSTDDICATLPLTLGVNFLSKWSIYWRSRASFYWSAHILLGSMVGFGYTW